MKTTVNATKEALYVNVSIGAEEIIALMAEARPDLNSEYRKEDCKDEEGVVKWLLQKMQQARQNKGFRHGKR